MKKINKVFIFTLMFFVLTISVFASPKTMEEQEIIVSEILIEGNYHAPKDIIKDEIVNTKIGEVLDKEKVQKDIENIYNTGYFENVEVDLIQKATKFALLFTVTQNPIIVETKVFGNESIASDEILNVVKSKKNRMLNNKILEQDINNILTLYEMNGYLGTKIKETNLVKDEEMSSEIALRGYLEFYISEGIVDKIIVNGLSEKEKDKYKDDIIVKEGKPLQSKDLEKTYHNLFETKDFTDVNIKIDSLENNKIDVIVELDVKKTGSYNIGVGYNEKDGFLFFGDLKEKDLFKSSKEIALNAEKSQKGYDVGLSYKDPYFVKETVLKSGLRFGKENRERNNKTIDKIDFYDVFINLSKDINEVTIFSDLNFEKYESSNENYNNGLINTLTLGINTDTRKELFHPKDGYEYLSWVELSSSLLGSDYNYRKLFLQTKQYKPGLFENHAIAFKGDLGFSKGDTPYFKKFVASNSDRLKSFDYGELRGKNFFVGNLEYRMPVWEDIALLIASYNFGSAWDEKFEETNHEIGIGAKIDLHGNIVRIDGAINQNKESKFKLSMGTNF
ncbi:MAG: BamA/OMP85 family outer membrane protein [archaeon]